MEAFIQCLAPFAPHISEELWHILGHDNSIHTSTFPEYNPQALIQDSVEVLIQVNSKIKAKLVIPSDTSEEELASLALTDERISLLLQGKSIKKRIFVANKLINFIVA
jgi:leucyl-tRNA synthetase